MCRFFLEDLVAFKADPSILGTIEQIWTDPDQQPSEATDNCYFHKDLPLNIRRTWIREGRLLPGFVVVEFLNEEDGFCLISEKSLRLVDRSLAVGDLVKRKPSDFQSGVVVSTAIQCTLKPRCTLRDFRKVVDLNKVSKFPNLTNKCSQCRNLPASCLLLEAPASELTNWGCYHEEDFIIYKDWIGQILDITTDVTIRLTNGSVVTVDDPHLLEEPCFYEGSSSAHFVHRLHQAKFEPRHSPALRRLVQSIPTNASCFPGQLVQTKKANLRLGRWLFGAYDPNVEPYGIVVQCPYVQLEVEWLFPNLFKDRNSQDAPPSLLSTDDFNSGNIIVYDRSKRPRKGLTQQLDDASYGPDAAYGHSVRFKDPAGAAVKYSRKTKSLPSQATFDRIPRVETQGFDMNNLTVVETRTKVFVEWQDGRRTLESSSSLDTYLDPDNHDVWPGENVSLLESEKFNSSNGIDFVRTKKVGVVQSVSEERVARVRWYEDPIFDLDSQDKAHQYLFSKYGAISNEYTDVSLYEVAAHPGLQKRRGNMVLVFPEKPHLNSEDIGLYISRAEKLPAFRGSENWQNPDRHGASVLDETQNSIMDQAITQAIQLNSEAAYRSTIGSGSNSSLSIVHPETYDCFAEIIDVCLDGDIVVRFGASPEAEEIKIRPDRVLVIASGDTIGSEGDSSWIDDDETASATSESINADFTESDDGHRTDESAEAIDIEIDHEGGVNLNTEENDVNMWLTDDEEEDVAKSHSMPSNGSNEKSSSFSNATFPDSKSSDASGCVISNLVSSTNHANFPPSFFVLDSPVPQDHRYLSKSSTPLKAALLRRISKEHKILASSLPEGVFVRSWETRLDILRILIIGPADTPYEYAPFMIDMHFNSSFPDQPPDTYFHSWTNNAGRINPNLYEDGKICLSLLGTWPSDKTEAWSAKNSTILQVIVSLMGLVLVKEPYYNEAGYEVLMGTPESSVPSTLYSEKAYVLSKGFIKRALSAPPQGLEDVTHWLYISGDGPRLLRRVIDDCKRLQANSWRGKENVSDVSTKGKKGGWAIGRLSAGAMMLLNKHLLWLQQYLREMEAAIDAPRVS